MSRAPFLQRSFRRVLVLGVFVGFGTAGVLIAVLPHAWTHTWSFWLSVADGVVFSMLLGINVSIASRTGGRPSTKV